MLLKHKCYFLHQRYYRYIVLASTICLFLTIVIYKAVPNLLNPFMRLMVHFTFVMMLADVSKLVVEWKPDLNTNIPKVCTSLGTL